MTPHVYILTTCFSPTHLPGTLLVFDTLRTGFPTAKITVVDNASHPATIAAIERAAAGVEAEFLRYANRTEHGAFINEIVLRETGPVVFLDTDIVFWDNCEEFTFGEGTVLAGRFIPRLETETSLHLPRIHPSFMWVTDCARLREVRAECANGSQYFRGFAGYQMVMDGKVVTADVGAAVYGYASEICEMFSPWHLERYDHLFLGSVPELVDELGLPDQLVDVIKQGHALIATPEKLKGLWRKQNGKNIEWNYLAGKLIHSGGEYGVFVARFHDLIHDEWFAHAGITDYTNGTHVGGPVEIVSPTEVRAAWGSIDLRPVGGSATFRLPERRYGPAGWTDVYTCTDVPTLCHIKRPEGDAVGLGDFWYDSESGAVPPGSGWTWAGIRLDGGRAYVVRSEGGQTEFFRLLAGQDPRRIGGVVHEDGYELEGQRYTLINPVSGEIMDPVRSLRYTESYCAVYDQRGQRVGFAFVETVPQGNGTAEFGPTQREMFLRWANGNRAAAECVYTLWRGSQIADDLSDDDTPSRLKSAAVTDLLLTSTVDLQRNDFYIANREYLEPVITSALLFWDASNDWAVSNRRDTQFFGYTHREAFGQVIVAVAYLTGGMEFARQVLRELHAYFHDSGRVESFDSWRKEQTDG